MKKKVFGRKLSRDRGSRKALFRSLVKVLIRDGKIITTKAKAKSVQGEIDKYITLVKKGDGYSRRRVYAKLANDKESVKKLFGEISRNFSERTSGYTRIVNLPQRRGDNTEVVRLEWTKEIKEGSTMANTKDSNNTGGKNKIGKIESTKETTRGKNLKDRLGVLSKKSAKSKK